MNVYLELTRAFNAGRLRAIVCSGQAVVLHRLAIMSKDGDWILREDAEALDHVLSVLSGYGARYRYGAPLDLRWMRGGWSAHFQFTRDVLRVRTDFFTRPPRIGAQRLQAIWTEQEGREPPFLDAPDLAEVKKTDREKDYPVIGELARSMSDARDRLLHSRSARDLIQLAEEHGDLLGEMIPHRSVLAVVTEGRHRLEAALDAERRDLMAANELRLASYEAAARGWAGTWRSVQDRVEDLTLAEAHAVVVAEAEGILPFGPQEVRGDGEA